MRNLSKHKTLSVLTIMAATFLVLLSIPCAAQGFFGPPPCGGIIVHIEGPMPMPGPMMCLPPPCMPMPYPPPCMPMPMPAPMEEEYMPALPPVPPGMVVIERRSAPMYNPYQGGNEEVYPDGGGYGGGRSIEPQVHQVSNRSWNKSKTWEEVYRNYPMRPLEPDRPAVRPEPKRREPERREPERREPVVVVPPVDNVSPPPAPEPPVHVLEKPTTDQLMAAVKRGRASEVHNLIVAGVDVNGKVGPLESTPLHAAAGLGNSEIVKILLDAGANPNVYMRGSHTPLHAAAFGNHVEVVGLLIQHGASLNDRDENARTALHMAAMVGGVESVSLLLRNGADVQVFDSTDENGTRNNFTPMDWAKKLGHTEVEKVLKQAIG